MWAIELVIVLKTKTDMLLEAIKCPLFRLNTLQIKINWIPTIYLCLLHLLVYTSSSQLQTNNKHTLSYIDDKKMCRKEKHNKKKVVPKSDYTFMCWSWFMTTCDKETSFLWMPKCQVHIYIIFFRLCNKLREKFT